MKIENKEISEACELFKILGGGACRTLVKILDNNLDKYLLPYLERLEFKKIGEIDYYLWICEEEIFEDLKYISQCENDQ